jgi:hypothetical protein
MKSAPFSLALCRATIVQAMWNDARSNAGVISTDATSARIQPAKGDSNLRQACKKEHFFTAVVDCAYVLFAYTEKHTQEFVKKLFGGFTGYPQSDASSVYDILDRGPPTDKDEGVSLVGCFAHCRRYFFEAAVCRYAVGVQGLMRIRAIYAADEPLKKLPPAKRGRLRDQHVRPLVDSFFESAQEAKASAERSNLATRALGYAANQEHELRRVLDDPRLPLDNTRAERALRKVVVGRKVLVFTAVTLTRKPRLHSKSCGRGSPMAPRARRDALDRLFGKWVRRGTTPRRDITPRTPRRFDAGGRRAQAARDWLGPMLTARSGPGWGVWRGACKLHEPRTLRDRSGLGRQEHHRMWPC